MRIVIVCDVLGEENNGTTIASMNLIRYLKGRGHEVRILCADKSREGEDGFYVVPTLNLGIFNKRVEKAGVTLAKGHKPTILKALDGADHVHIMMPFSLGNKTAAIAKKMGLPITAGFHMQAQNFTAYLGMSWLAPLNLAVYHTIYRTLYRHVDAIHYPTEFIKGVFEGAVRKKTRGYVISNGVNSYVGPRAVERPRELRDKIVIATTGRYAREKSQDTLIKAVSLSRHKDKIQLILGGQGVKENCYRRLAKRLPIEPIFKFYSRNEITEVLNYADLYVHPAEVELEGISCTEAIVTGRLTIVSDSKHAATGNFAVDEKCVFKNRNPRDLARVIDFWIDNPDLRREYEGKYFESSDCFDQQCCMERMEEMITEICNEKKRA